jgi:hypothetical protein
MKKLTIQQLRDRAIKAAKLFRLGMITRVEAFRLEMDAALSEDTGDIIFEMNTDYIDGTM